MSPEPEAPQPQTCGNCAFAFPISAPHSAGDPTIECRYNPPSIFAGVRNSGVPVASFPPVLANWWCNFWKQIT